MAIISFYTNGKRETGNTIATIALATYLAFNKNQRILAVSTGWKDMTMNECFWTDEVEKKKAGIFGNSQKSASVAAETGVDGLDRMIRSNRISSNAITNYTKVALSGRLEILLGSKGTLKEYREVQAQYPQIVSFASDAYNYVLVDIDKNLDKEVQKQILSRSDIIVAMSTQRTKDIERLLKLTQEEKEIFTPRKTFLALGKYDDHLRNNAKNVSRMLLKSKDIVNTIPYNSLLYEAVQDGQLVDLFLKILNLKERDENKFFVDELKRLAINIDNRIIMLQMNG